MTSPTILDLERASCRAVPAAHAEWIGPWLAQAGGGAVSRVDSTIAFGETRAAADLLDAVERWYRDRSKRPTFRLTPLDAELDSLLAARGYSPRAREVRVLVRSLRPALPPAFALLELEEWIGAFRRLSGEASAPRLDEITAIIRRLRLPHRAVAVPAAGPPAAVGLLVLDGVLGGIFDVVTDAALRRQGHARTLVHGLLALAHEAGAEHAYLQVSEDNRPALALYGGLHFTEAYRYWYRILDD